MFLSTVGKYLTLSKEIMKLSILQSMEYRASFLTQVIGMFVNDIGLVLLWVIFFQKFPQVNGWAFKDMALLYAIFATSYAITFICADGISDLSKKIAHGDLDYFLSLPKNVLWQIAISKSSTPAIGDLLFGIAIFFFWCSPTLSSTLVFILVSLMAALLSFSFNLFVNSLEFFIPGIFEATDNLMSLLMSFGNYPYTIYHGVLKVVSMTIIPGFFVIALPVSLVRTFSLTELLLLVIGTASYFLIAVTMFFWGLKRYESGNLINVRA
jgi:ABC-2 type transport system permease protein